MEYQALDRLKLRRFSDLKSSGRIPWTQIWMKLRVYNLKCWASLRQRGPGLLDAGKACPKATQRGGIGSPVVGVQHCAPSQFVPEIALAETLEAIDGGAEEGQVDLRRHCLRQWSQFGRQGEGDDVVVHRQQLFALPIKLLVGAVVLARLCVA